MTEAANRLDRLKLYRMMKLIRRTQELLMAEYHPADQMRCPMHFCIGQESAPAVLSQLLRERDVLMSHYRSHGYYLAKGGSLNEMVAEFYGQITGANRGVAGSMELGSHAQHFFSGAIVGGSIVIPLGAAFAQRYTGSDDISIAVIGDGSFDEGILYESMNLAALQKLPLLILCENNKYAANSDITARLGRPELLPKTEAMGVPGAVVDGYDLDALFNTLATTIAAIRRAQGPRYVEVTTYRYCAHVGPESDDYLEYRPPEEIAAWRSKDPLHQLRASLDTNPGSFSQLAKIDSEVEEEVLASIAAAKAAPFPTFAWALGITSANSYAPGVEHYFRELHPTFRGGQGEPRLEPF
jgi:TPP-dependent pyruvate/acetoin dehydrogenase alpha subunit